MNSKGCKKCSQRKKRVGGESYNKRIKAIQESFEQNYTLTGEESEAYWKEEGPKMLKRLDAIIERNAVERLKDPVGFAKKQKLMSKSDTYLMLHGIRATENDID
jgi:hypothetical protein